MSLSIPVHPIDCIIMMVNGPNQGKIKVNPPVFEKLEMPKGKKISIFAQIKRQERQQQERIVAHLETMPQFCHFSTQYFQPTI
ncbi:MAG: hypothetical protein KUG74_15425 [Rhodobacteraceae bacterium]|nr:hypothetical protein [Paracoccaceae bacterium]